MMCKVMDARLPCTEPPFPKVAVDLGCLNFLMSTLGLVFRAAEAPLSLELQVLSTSEHQVPNVSSEIPQISDSF